MYRHLSVDSKFPTVDIHCWYEDSTLEKPLKPTCVGITLSYFNWKKLKKAIVQVDDEIPEIIAISACWHDIQDQMFCD